MPLWKHLAGNRAARLPVPMMNIINGGAHADNNVDLQEFMILPIGLPNFSEALRAGVEIFHALKSVLKSRGLATAVGDEGGFAPDLKSNEEAIETILEAIGKAGYKAGERRLARPRRGQLGVLRERQVQPQRRGQAPVVRAARRILRRLVREVSDRDDRRRHGRRRLGRLEGAHRSPRQDRAARRRRYLRDQSEIFREGIDKGIGNAILIKVNQIGTLTETLEAIAMADAAKYAAVISHRSGETEDTTIADLSVATTATQIKTGSLCRSDRVAKYNQLLRIEEALGSAARYAGKDAFPNLPDFGR